MAADEADPDPELATNETWRGIMVRARKGEKLTQAQLAKRIGTSQVVISQIEIGEVRASKFVRAICRVLKITEPMAFEDPDDAAWHALGRLLREKGMRKFLLAKAFAEEMAGVADNDEQPKNDTPAKKPDRNHPRYK